MPFFKRIAGSDRKVAGKTKREATRVGGMLPGFGQVGMNNAAGILSNFLGGLGLAIVKTPGGGVPALSGTTPGSGDCTLMSWDGTTFQASSPAVTLPVRNPWDVAAGANKTAIVGRFAATYWLITWKC